MDFLFDRKRRSVKIVEGSKSYLEMKYRALSVEELKSFQFFLERSIAVYETLEKARDSYEGGRAKYEDAAEQVKSLIDGSNSAAQELVATCRKVDEFFDEDSKPSEFFAGQTNDFIAFCRKFVEEHSHPEGLRGNSSRARTGNSRRARPKTATSAGVSSSTQKEPECAPASAGK